MAVAITTIADVASVAASSNVATYTAHSTGTAAHDRHIYLGVSCENSSVTNITATADWGTGDVSSQTSSAFVQLAGGAVCTRIFGWHMPVGTTATFKVTFTGASPTASQNHVTVWNVTGAIGATVTYGTDSSTDMDATDALTTGSTTIASGGGMLAIACCATGSTNSKTWSQLTETQELNIGTTYCHTTATSTTAGTQTRTCTGANNEDGALAFANFTANASVERLPARVDLALSPTASTVFVSDYGINPAARDLALSPTQPAVGMSKDLNTVELVFSTTAPTVSVQAASNADISPARVDLVISPTAPTSILAVASDPPRVDLALSTTAPTLDKGILPARVDLALSTTAPTSILAVAADPPRRDLVLSPTAPTLDLGLNPPRVDLVISRTAPTVDVTASDAIVPGRVDLVISPSQPAIGTSKDLNTVNLVLSTTAPTVQSGNNVSISPAKVDLVISPTAPDAGLAWDIPIGQLVISGTAPTVGLGLNPPRRDLVLSPTAPSVNVASAGTIIPANADLVLSTFAPTATLQIGISPSFVDLVLSTSAPIIVSTGSVVVTEPPDVAGGGGKGKGRGRRRTADEELTEAEVQWMMRKLAELRRAKEEKEKERLAKELEVALAQASNDDDAAEIITETIEEYHPEPLTDYAPVMRNLSLLSDLIGQLDRMVKDETRRQMIAAADEDDIEILLLTNG